MALLNIILLAKYANEDPYHGNAFLLGKCEGFANGRDQGKG